LTKIDLKKSPAILGFHPAPYVMIFSANRRLGCEFLSGHERSFKHFLLPVESQMNVNIFISRKKGEKLICMIKRLWKRNGVKYENCTRKRTLIKRK
jgi:hypothetical protein